MYGTTFHRCVADRIVGALRLVTSPLILLFRDLRKRIGWRMLPVVAVMVANGLASGLGAALLLPFLSVLGMGKGTSVGSTNGIGFTLLRIIGANPSVTEIILILVSVFLLQSMLALGEGWLTSRFRSTYVANWRTDLFKAMFDAQWRYFSQQKTGELLNTLLNETARLSTAFYLISLAVAGAFFIATYLVVAFFASWQVALSITVFGVAMSLAVRPMIRRAQNMGEEVTQLNRTMHVLISEFLAGAKLIKATASEERATHMFVNLVKRTSLLERNTAFHPSLIRAVYEIAATAILGGGMWVGFVWMNVSPAAILVVIFVFMRIYMRLSEVQQCFQNLHANFAPAIVPLSQALDRARLEVETESAGAIVAPPLPSGTAGATIRLSNVSVRYRDRPALSSISLEIKSGTVIGVAGPSGAGKSTLIDSILGLVPIESGEIEIDGRSLSELSLRGWRRAIGYVAQDTFLFNASIADNIRWGNPHATEAEIETAARRAHADEFVRALPQGYQTEVGDRGVRLSGGQRQRIGLARALVGKARLLILDEATSSLDSEAERAVLDAIDELRGQLTVIMVAHRLSTLRNADFLCLIENGQLLETGRWDQLIRQGTRFNEFWTLQSDANQMLAQE